MTPPPSVPVAKTPVSALLSALRAQGIRASGNYMIGYPTENIAEIHRTILMTKRHVENGSQYALFFNVMLFPGSLLHAQAIAGGRLDADFDPETMC